MLFYEKWEIITEISDSWKIQNVNIFYQNVKNMSVNNVKNSPKMDKFFDLLPYIQRVAISVLQS